MKTVMQHPRSPSRLAQDATAPLLLAAFTSTTGATLDTNAVQLSVHDDDDNDDDRGLGLVARTDLPADHLLFSIPTSALLGSDPAAHCPVPARDLLLAHPSSAMANPTIHLAVTLLYHALSTKTPLPLWDAYVDALPTSVPSPAYLPTDQIHLLPPHFSAFQDAKDIHTALHALFSVEDPSAFGHCLQEALSPLLSSRSLRDNLFAAFVWAYAMVESRAFRPFASTRPDLPVLVPFADLMNHSSFPNEVNVKYTLTRGSLHFVTTRAVTATEPLVLKYNDLSNAQQLVYYGFAQRGNPFHDPVRLALPVLADDEDVDARAIKHALLVDAPPIGNLSLTHAIVDPSSSANVLLSARVHVATLHELHSVLKVSSASHTAQLDLGALVQGLGDHNDARAYALMTRAVTHLKQQLTEAVDLALLPSAAHRTYVQSVWEQVNAFILYFDLPVPCIGT